MTELNEEYLDTIALDVADCILGDLELDWVIREFPQLTDDEASYVHRAVTGEVAVVFP